MSTRNEANATTPLVGESDSSPHPTVGKPTRTFGDQPMIRTDRGLVVPKLGLGTWQLDEAAAASMVSEALRMGYRHIDTAQMYGNERGVGRGLAESGVDRSEIFLTTKMDNDHHAPDDLVRSVEASLKALGTDHVDLLLLHWPVGWDVIGATLATMAQVQASGLAHHIGVSNFTIDQLEVARNHAPLEVLQVECHPFFQQDDLRTWCVDHDWIFVAYSPIAQGKVLEEPELMTIADELGDGFTAIETALAWLLSLDRVGAIPRTTNVEHLRSNFRALDIQLSAQQEARIRRLDRGERIVDPPHAPWS